MDTLTIRIKRPTEDKQALINILTVEERLAALLQAAQDKAQRLAGKDLAALEAARKEGK